MFGLIVSGQLVQTDFLSVGETKFLTGVTNAENINHIVVFLTGTIPFPHGFGGLVYFSMPDPINPPAWHLLGYISNEKPSAIFKVSNLKKCQTHMNPDGTQFVFGLGKISIAAQIGISIESLASIQQQCPTTVPTPETSLPADVVKCCRKMLEHLANYTLSFSVTQSEMRPSPTETYIPLSSFQTWYSNFERRQLQNPDFWRD